LNLQHQPAAVVEIGARTLSVTAIEVTGAEYEHRWQRYVAAYPGFAKYRTKTSRHLPIFILTRPTTLTGTSVLSRCKRVTGRFHAPVGVVVHINPGRRIQQRNTIQVAVLNAVHRKSDTDHANRSVDSGTPLNTVVPYGPGPMALAGSPPRSSNPRVIRWL